MNEATIEWTARMEGRDSLEIERMRDEFFKEEENEEAIEEAIEERKVEDKKD